MWRSFFLALGLAAVSLGAELLAIDQATITKPSQQNRQQNTLINTVHESMHSREFVPPEWAPWTLLSVGAVIVLYSATVSHK